MPGANGLLVAADVTAAGTVAPGTDRFHGHRDMVRRGIRHQGHRGAKVGQRGGEVVVDGQSDAQSPEWPATPTENGNLGISEGEQVANVPFTNCTHAADKDTVRWGHRAVFAA